ncbi:hypothetical protein KDW_20180 [Dictyobacter vulcani]|uniref:DUF4878 domain-containing protein n=1 Tax=Dictyobacter vulcani TaxID=2607529 RepID=A0A5J4KRR4_9CHLR|nr:hypothetical protein [Dictyobacter vulcani]GER87856.1 hypothetical protein KDW_20180 [Dictyobacter vulcani]
MIRSVLPCDQSFYPYHYTYPTPTPVVEPKTAILSIPVVADYCQAVKAKNYVKAYTFLDPSAATDRGQKLTQDTYIQMAKTSDVENGSIVDMQIDPASTDSTRVILTIDRSSSIHYHVHLTLKKVAKTWKITVLDRV